MRRAIINIDHIVQIDRSSKDDLWIVMKSGARVPLSRRYRTNLETLIGNL
jgi:DNA-binding LytR/AlgR family response regulator